MSAFNYRHIDDLTIHRFFEEYSSIKDFILTNEKSIEKRAFELRKLLKEDIKENPDVKEKLEEIYEEDINAYPSFSYNAYFIASYSLLEFILNKVCEILYYELDLRIKVSDLAGSGILLKSKNYLTKVLSIDFKDLDKEWIEITKYQKIRNLIVHENSSINFEPNKKRKILNLVKQFKKLEINENEGFFKIKNSGFLLDFIRLSEVFLKKALERVNEKNFRFLRDHNSDKDEDEYLFPDEDLPF